MTVGKPERKKQDVGTLKQKADNVCAIPMITRVSLGRNLLRAETLRRTFNDYPMRSEYTEVPG